MSRRESIESEIASLKTRIQELEKEREEIQEDGPAEKLAVALHHVLCRTNYTDSCGWFYEQKKSRSHRMIEQWDGSTHRQYLGIAKDIIGRLSDVSPDTIIRVVESLRHAYY